MVTAHPEVQGIWALLYRQVVPCNRQKGAHVEVLSVVLLQEFFFCGCSWVYSVFLSDTGPHFFPRVTHLEQPGISAIL